MRFIEDTSRSRAEFHSGHKNNPCRVSGPFGQDSAAANWRILHVEFPGNIVCFAVCICTSLLPSLVYVCLLPGCRSHWLLFLHAPAITDADALLNLGQGILWFYMAFRFRSLAGIIRRQSIIWVRLEPAEFESASRPFWSATEDEGCRLFPMAW